MKQKEKQYKLIFEINSKLKNENMSDPWSDQALGLIRTSAMLCWLSDPSESMIDHDTHVLTYPNLYDWRKVSRLGLVPSLAEI